MPIVRAQFEAQVAEGILPPRLKSPAVASPRAGLLFIQVGLSCCLSKGPSSMESCNLRLNKPDEFHHMVHGDDRIPALPSNIDLEIITKDNVTETGRAGALITWTCETPDGRVMRAQYTTTIRLLKVAFGLIHAAYDDEGRRRT